MIITLEPFLLVFQGVCPYFSNCALSTSQQCKGFISLNSIFNPFLMFVEPDIPFTFGGLEGKITREPVGETGPPKYKQKMILISII